ncbi:MAG: isocitrate lyase/phosphoenolpyruvate mutase family protein [Bacteroidetes bacterium]|nr:isocitrate lyase/phosphoenolpyruvate mutase family protein [Bacteroidota bacterium]
MSSDYQTFKHLHYADQLLVLPNAWDAHSAVRFQEKGFPAVATSSAAVAQSLGYADGENMPFEEYLFVIKRIHASIRIPFSVDLEMGYGSSAGEIAENILKLVDLGVAGINIEDSTITGSQRTLKDARAFAHTLEQIRNMLWSKELFINVRCDTYILGVDNKQEETRLRLQLYETAGADGIFLPCITQEKEIMDAISNTRLPLNVMYVPGLPDPDTLSSLGVRRLSMGPFFFSKAYQQIDILTKHLFTDKITTT